jgi:hypothetical protein
LAPLNETLYFWDGHETGADPNSPNDNVFEICTSDAPDDTGNPEDACNRKTDGTFKRNGIDANLEQSDVRLQVYKLEIQLKPSGGNPYTLPVANFVGPGAAHYEPADNTSHAYVYGRFDDSADVLFEIGWEFDNYFVNSFDALSNDTIDTLQVGVIYYPELPQWLVDNKWHRSLQMVIDDDYSPAGNNTNCAATTTCLTLQNLGGVNNNLVSLLILAGELPGPDDEPDGFLDELQVIYEAENRFNNMVFDKRAGNDNVLVIQ